MKQIPFKTIGTATLVFLLITANIKVAHTNQSAPPAGGLSGDPSRSSCALIGCHFGSSGATYSFSTGQLTLNMGSDTSSLIVMSGQSYNPGQTYYIEFKPNLTNGNSTRYGFQMTSLDASGNMAGAFAVLNSSNSSTQSLLSRNYIGHKNANSNNDWLFKWTAPAAGTGAITFYYAANIANGNNDNSGDSIYLGTTTLSPVTATGIDNPIASNFNYLGVYPNPSYNNYIHLDFNNISGNEAFVSLFTLDGKKIQEDVFKTTVGLNSLLLNLNPSIVKGIYLVQLAVGNSKEVKRVTIF
ncbi:MAG TPA: choice-of-anchor V domain-containing protein [Chitinophagales bacterium]|nr:choice-of-anchor V domain-containing protein [Chitinophagales bacterium]